MSIVIVGIVVVGHIGTGFFQMSMIILGTICHTRSLGYLTHLSFYVPKKRCVLKKLEEI